MESLVSLDRQNWPIAVVLLNRPKALNALNQALLTEFRQIIDELSQDHSCRVLIVTAGKDQAFCAGADLKERLGMTLEQTRSYLSLIGETFERLENAHMPTIAAIDGIALGGGLELALACDIRIAHPRAHMGLSEVALGVIPGAGGTQRLTRIVGPAKAKELIFTARRVSAAEALELKLVNQVCEENESALDLAMMMANQIVQNAPLAVAAAKKAMYSGLGASPSEGLQAEKRAYESIIMSEDRKEGLRAFSEKRKPVYRGV